jgi:ABC-type uncharacterized transport system permease subunit
MLLEMARIINIGRFRLEMRQAIPFWTEAVIVTGAIIAGVTISVVILLATGVDLSDILDTFIVGNLSNAHNRSAVLAQMAPLLLAGLSATLAFRVRFWNIGIEGQMICGGIGATAITLYDVGPIAIHLSLMILCSAVGGLFWAVIAAVMKYRFRVNEIIWTLLSNYIALYFLYHLLFGPWRDKKLYFPQSPLFASAERFGKILGAMPGELVLGLIAVAVLAWLVHFAKVGFYMRFVEANNRMSKAIGLPVISISIGAVALSGAVAGMAGLVLASQQGRLSADFVSGYGFAGIIIAFLSRNNPISVALVALLIAMLFDAGRSLQVFNQIPFSMVQLIEAIIVMSVASSEFFVRHRLRWSRV